MKTSYKLMFWAANFFLPVFSFSQYALVGTVSNYSNSESIPGAKVILTNSYHRVITDQEGYFEITNVKNGTYYLEISSTGFVMLRDTIVINGRDISQNYSMDELTYLSDEVLITSTRANDQTPTTYTNLSSQKIEKINYGQDIPYLFNLTPSVVITSDAGAGIGYTGIRIRGVDPTRTNVTINGIPVNDSESHGTWWVNMPDLASSIDNVQIQRGVGTSSNGAASFGASINIKTNEVNKNPYAEISSSYGSFNTMKGTIRLGSGLINNKFTLDARLSKINSDGYIDRAYSDLSSYYISGAWLGRKSVLRLTHFSGKETTYQSWWGTPQSVVSGNQDSLLSHYYNNLWSYSSPEDSTNLFSSGRTYNFYTYENEVDNYQQDHYQLHYSQQLSENLDLMIAGHYTYGRGYYEQYRRDDDFSTYGIAPLILNSDTISTGDFIRRRWLDNQFYGAVFSLNYNSKSSLDLTWGGAVNQYSGKHFGEIIWAEFAAGSDIRDRYYENNSLKNDASTYLKGNYEWNKFNFYADIQYRYIDYQYYGPAVVDSVISETDQKVNYNFFNPKAGILFSMNDRNNFYLSFGIANREPNREDFVNRTNATRPSHETLQNLEAGYNLKGSKFMLNTNLFLMNYQNQLILTGALSDVGAYIRTNVSQSYRAGIELEGGIMITKKISFTSTVTYSQNKVKSFTEYLDDYDLGGQKEIVHTNTDLAFSPNLIAAAALEFIPFKGFSLGIQSKYVGRQYLDNTSNSYRSLDPYFVTNADINYVWKSKFFRELIVGVQLNNLLNEMYSNNGYTWGYIYGGQRYTENFLYPQAGFNFMTRLVIKL